MANSTEHNKSLALFCDFENIALGVRDAKYQKFDIHHVLEKLLVKGSIVVKKAYCDWTRYKDFKAAMHEASFELIDIPHVRQSGKNSADIRMVVDALDLCYTKAHVDTFVIISGDSDFSPLVSKLRENAKTVIGVGVKNSTSDLLIGNCDEFIYYDDLVRALERKRPSRKRAKKRSTRSEAVDAGSDATPTDGEAVENDSVDTGDKTSGSSAKKKARSKRTARKRTASAVSAKDAEAVSASPEAVASDEAGPGDDAPLDAEDAEDAETENRATAGSRRLVAGSRRKRAKMSEFTDETDAAATSGLSVTHIRGDAEPAEGDSDSDVDENESDDPDEERIQEGLDLVLATAADLSADRDGNDKLWGSMVKQTLKRRRPGFNESYYGFESFGRMLEEAQARGFVQLELDDRSGGYIIRKVTQ